MTSQQNPTLVDEELNFSVTWRVRFKFLSCVDRFSMFSQSKCGQFACVMMNRRFYVVDLFNKKQ